MRPTTSLSTKKPTSAAFVRLNWTVAGPEPATTVGRPDGTAAKAFGTMKSPVRSSAGGGGGGGSWVVVAVVVVVGVVSGGLRVLVIVQFADWPEDSVMVPSAAQSPPITEV